MQVGFHFPEAATGIILQFAMTSLQGEFLDWTDIPGLCAVLLTVSHTNLVHKYALTNAFHLFVDGETPSASDGVALLTFEEYDEQENDYCVDVFSYVAKRQFPNLIHM